MLSPRPMPERRTPLLAGAVVVALLAPIFLIAGWRIEGWALGADAYAIKPITRAWLLGTLQQQTGQPPSPRVLVIDDEAMARYIFTQCLAGASYLVEEAASGAEGVQRARRDRPSYWQVWGRSM